MTREELLQKHHDEEYDNYVKHYLIQHWKDESEKGNWRDLVSIHFADRHSVEGTITEKGATDKCRERSHEGTRDFTSTSLPASYVTTIVRYIATNIIEWHGKNRRPFTNYEISVTGTMITVKCTAGKGYTPTQYRDKVVVGISPEGLITHFHGDIKYAEKPIFRKDGNSIVRIDKD
jgi:hypothetical protein